MKTTAGTPIFIFGAGGHAGKAVNIATRLNLNVLGLISTEPPGTSAHGHRVLGYQDYFNTNTHCQAPDTRFHIAIGENSIRKQIFSQFNLSPDRLISLNSPRSHIAEDVIIGNGSFIGENAILQTYVSIGHCSIIDSGSIIEHDVFIGEFATISPGAIICGGSRILANAIVGAGAIVIEKVTIGQNSLVGAGSVVLENVEPDVVVVGNPARYLRRRALTERYLR